MTKTQPKQPRTTVIYARVSLDREGNQLAVDRQLALCRKLAAQRGLEVIAEHVDNSISATSGKRRPAFEALLASRPESITAWHVDRLCRVTKDLERVIELGCDVYTVQAGDVDLSTSTGRAMARTITAWATNETELKAARQRAANDQRAASGLPYSCQRAFGYEADGITRRPREAGALRWAALGVARGRTLGSLAQILNDRGILTATGKTWRSTTLKAALLSPRNAGLRQHRGEVVGKGTWTPILDEDTLVVVRSILTDPKRARTGRPRTYLLSGIMRCSVCGATMVGATTKDKGPTYRCPGLGDGRSHPRRNAGPVDAFVLAVVIGRLSQPDAIDLWADADRTDEIAALREEAATLRARKDALATALIDGLIDAQALAAGSRRAQERMEEIERRIASAVDDPTLREVATADDVELAFLALPQETQRRLIDVLLTVTLLKVGPGHRTFNPETVRIEWKTPA